MRGDVPPSAEEEEHPTESGRAGNERGNSCSTQTETEASDWVKQTVAPEALSHIYKNKTRLDAAASITNRHKMHIETITFPPDDLSSSVTFCPLFINVFHCVL